ncbi:MAG: nucleotidyltransferase domain-containing protein [bacterium]|nr:nucleotidyltransferase domain-containing protein [bacterium]
MEGTRLAELGVICRRHGVDLVYLFGSQARPGHLFLLGEKVVAEDSLADLDVGVVGSRPLPPPAGRATFYALLHNDLAGLFAPFKLDLVLLEENHSVFQLEAIKGICVYQAGEDERSAYETGILRRAADFRPFLDRYLQERLEEV